MSCISSNFSSFFLNSLNDPSEFSKYLSNGELRFSSTFEDFQVYNNSSAQQQYQQQPQLYHLNGSNAGGLQTNGGDPMNNGDDGNSNLENTLPSSLQHQQQYGSYQQQQHPNNHPSTHPLVHLQQHQQRWTAATHPHHVPQHPQCHGHPALPPPSGTVSGPTTVAGSTAAGPHQPHFDGSFEFMKYLRHSNDYSENSHDGGGPHRHPHHHHVANASSGPTAIGTKSETSLNANNASLIDLDTTPHKVSRSSRKTPAMSSTNHSNSNSSSNNTAAAATNHPTPMAVDVYDHDSKHMLYDLHHMNSAHSSNSNESSMELSSLTYPNSHLNASNSNTSSEGGTTNQGHNDFSMLSVAAGTTSTAASAAAAGGNTDAAAAAASPAAPKPLATFAITENFEAHPSHKVEEGIFQHMNKLPAKKKENLKTLGVRFTGQMTLNDKSIIVDNFIKFCQEYDIQDHRPFLSLNQSGLNKPDQIKFARYLGQGLPTFTLFCIYSNFKNLFCTKRTEIYTKDGYNLPYILEKTKSFLANTAADLKNIINQQSNDGMDFVATTPATASATAAAAATPTAPAAPMITNLNNNNNTNANMNPLTTLPPPLIPTQQQQQQQLLQLQSPTSVVLNPIMVDYNHSNSMMPPTSTSVPAAAAAAAAAVPPPVGGAASSSTRPLENLMIFDNFDVHETHRIEDGICTQLSRLPPKKQELLKQFGIQTNQTVTYYEKYILIENFNRFCNEYKVADHRPFLDLSESGLPKSEQLKFIRYLGQGLPNLTLNKIYLVFKDILGLSRIEKMALEGYNLDAILKKKKKNLYNRMTAAAVHKECNPDVPSPAIPTAIAAVTQPTTAAPNPAPALMPIYHQDSYKT